MFDWISYLFLFDFGRNGLWEMNGMGLADLLAGLIEKYADVLDIDSLPDPKEKKNISEFIDLKCESVEIKEAA